MTAERRKFISLVATVVLVALAVAVVAILHLYRTALAMERERLTQTVESHALLIGAVARFDAIYSRNDNPEGATGATLSQVRDAYQQFKWFGETGEILIARLNDGAIEYINQQRFKSPVSAAGLPAKADRDGPMRRALAGQTGTIIARDYRDQRVLAAYAPVADLDIGLVAKIDMAEINAPYIHSAMIVGAGAVAIALVGLLLVGLVFPLFRLAETANERERQNLLAIFDSIDEPIHISDPLTYELLYVNEAFKQYWGDGLGQPCYQVINGCDSPCENCAIPRIFGSNVGQTYAYEWFNESTGRWFRSLDKAIHWPGRRLVRYEMAIDISTERQAQQAVIEQQNKIRALSSQLLLSEEQERKRLATQLHDQIGHALVAAKMKLVGLRQAEAPPQQTVPLAEIIALLESSIEDVRSLTFEISPPVLHELGLGPALEWLVEQARQRHGLDALFEATELPSRLEHELAVLLFQASRELLFNVYKHAAARHVWVRLAVKNDTIVVTVEDDGRGFAGPVDLIGRDPQKGYGLLSISERMRYLGGEMLVKSSPGSGTRVSLRAPLVFARSEVTAPQRAISAGAVAPTSDHVIRVLIADDHALMRRGIHSIAAASSGIEIVGEAENGQQAIDLAKELRPHVVVMDIDMPDVDGAQATQAILAELPETKILALSMHANRHYVRQMLAAGALGFLLKDSAAEELPAVIKLVDNNRIYLSPRITGVLVEEFVQHQGSPMASTIDILSSREKEVVQLIIDGDSTKQVAVALGISQKTAQAHRQNIFRKLGINSTAELVQLAIREGMLKGA